MILRKVRTPLLYHGYLVHQSNGIKFNCQGAERERALIGLQRSIVSLFQLFRERERGSRHFRFLFSSLLLFPSLRPSTILCWKFRIPFFFFLFKGGSFFLSLFLEMQEEEMPAQSTPHCARFPQPALGE